MNIYLDIVSPASKEAGRLASEYGLQNHGLVESSARALEPQHGRAL